MKIYLIRHGEDSSCYRGGWSNNPLTNKGVEQARFLASYFSKEFNEEKIKLISSDIKRASQTSQYISEKLGIPIVYEKEIREINNGELSGMSNEEAEKKYEGLYFNTLEYGEKYPKGESPKEFYERVSNYLDKLLLKKSDDTYLIVTHGGVINIILYIVKGIKWSNKSRPFTIDSGSITLLDYNSDEIEVVFENWNKKRIHLMEDRKKHNDYRNVRGE